MAIKTEHVLSSALTIGLIGFDRAFEDFAGIGAEPEVHLAAGLHLADFAFEDFGLDLDPAEIDEREQLPARVDVFARTRS